MPVKQNNREWMVFSAVIKQDTRLIVVIPAEHARIEMYDQFATISYGSSANNWGTYKVHEFDTIKFVDSSKIWDTVKLVGGMINDHESATISAEPLGTTTQKETL